MNPGDLELSGGESVYCSFRVRGAWRAKADATTRSGPNSSGLPPGTRGMNGPHSRFF
jgi:hypothetical protein